MGGGKVGKFIVSLSMSHYHSMTAGFIHLQIAFCFSIAFELLFRIQNY